MLAKKIKKALNVEAMNIVNNSGELAGQTIKHFHIHLIPRYENDGFEMKNISNKLSEKEFIDLVEKIKK